MLIRSYVQRKILIRSSVRADQTVVLITDTNLRRCSLKDCWFSAVSIQYRVVVAVIIDVIIIRHLQYCFVITSCVDCQHFFRQIFLGYFSDIVQAFDTLRTNVCGDDYTSLHNPIVLSSVLPAYGMFHSIQILFL